MFDRQPSDEWIEAANCLATVARTLSSVVHEANNMLQVIAGSAEMMQMQGQGQPASSVPSVVRRAEIIADHAHRVSALLGSVRDLSKCQPRRDGEICGYAAAHRRQSGGPAQPPRVDPRAQPGGG